MPARTAELQLHPTVAVGTIQPSPWRAEKRRSWLRQKEVISRQKITDIHTGFGLEAKNVDLEIRDESQMSAGYKKRTRRRIKFGALESTVQSSLVKVRGCGAKDVEEKEKPFRTDCNKVRGYREELKGS